MGSNVDTIDLTQDDDDDHGIPSTARSSGSASFRHQFTRGSTRYVESPPSRTDVVTILDSDDEDTDTKPPSRPSNSQASSVKRAPLSRQSSINSRSRLSSLVPAISEVQDPEVPSQRESLGKGSLTRDAQSQLVDLCNDEDVPEAASKADSPSLPYRRGTLSWFGSPRFERSTKESPLRPKSNASHPSLLIDDSTNPNPEDPEPVSSQGEKVSRKRKRESAISNDSVSSPGGASAALKSPVEASAQASPRAVFRLPLGASQVSSPGSAKAGAEASPRNRFRLPLSSPQKRTPSISPAAPAAVQTGQETDTSQRPSQPAETSRNASPDSALRNSCPIDLPRVNGLTSAENAVKAVLESSAAKNAILNQHRADVSAMDKTPESNTQTSQVANNELRSSQNAASALNVEGSVPAKTGLDATPAQHATTEVGPGIPEDLAKAEKAPETRNSHPVIQQTIKTIEHPANEVHNEEVLPQPGNSIAGEERGVPVPEPFPLPYHHLAESIERPSETSTVDQTMGDLRSFTNVLKRHLKEMRDDHESMMKLWLGKARSARRPDLPPLATPLESANPAGMMGLKHSTSPFARMKPLNITSKQKHTGSTARLTGESFTPSGSRNGKFTITAPVTSGQDQSKEVPDYMQYTSLRHNVLGTNTKQLQVWPYFGEDVIDMPEMYSALREYFEVTVDHRPRKVLMSQQARTYAPYFEAFLDEIGCSMDDILKFLLEIKDGEDGMEKTLSNSAQANNVRNVRSFVTKVMDEREKYCKEDFDRMSERWVSVLSSLPSTNDQAVWRAALACHVFWGITKFSPWQIARKYARFPEPEKIEGLLRIETDQSYATLACRICHRHDCPHHGENRDQADSDDDDAASIETVDAQDVDYPPRINFKQRVTAPGIDDDGVLGDDVDGPQPPTKALTKERKPVSWWMNEANSVTWDHGNRGPFFPCYHPGKACNEAHCSCFKERVCCEKTCGCSKACDRRYRGCSCAQGKRRKLCAQDDSCECFKMNRECDPDLCGSCGVDVVLNPENRYDDEIVKGKCHNAPIQLGRPKRTLLGNSIVHGFGLFAGEPIKKDEYVGEYQGEIIDRQETERRGTIYEFQKLSYIFALNKDQEIDSQRFGNKIRFINHAAEADRSKGILKKTSLRNISPRIMLCNTAHRIGMYAIKDINKGDELFFDYGKEYHEKLYKGDKSDEPKQKAVPKSHNRSLIQDFVEPKMQPSTSRTARKSNEYRQPVEDEEADNADESYDTDDDRPIKRVRAEKKPTIRINGPKKPDPKSAPTILRLNRHKVAKKTEDRSHLRKSAATSLEGTPAAIPLPAVRKVNAAFKSAPDRQGVGPPKKAARKSTPAVRLVTRNDEREGTQGQAGDEDESEFDSTGSGDDEDGSAPPRRSGRSRTKSRKLLRNE